MLNWSNNNEPSHTFRYILKYVGIYVNLILFYITWQQDSRLKLLFGMYITIDINRYKSSNAEKKVYVALKIKLWF